MSKHEINIENTYSFPTLLRKICYNDKIIIVAPQFANWIVLLSQDQLEIFNFLVDGKSIKEVLESHLFDREDVNYVITQIEARRLCRKQVHSTVDESRSLHLYLTNKCNLLCPHCYMHSGKANVNELSTEEVISLIRDYRTIAQGTRLTLSGGEPSVHSDFEKIVSTAYKLGIDVKLLTNGALMTAERIDKIADCISSVQISIDGYSEETNKKIRGVGHFSKALDAVDNFIKHGVETSIAITPSLESLRDNSECYIRFAKELLIKYADKPFEVKFAEGLSIGRNIRPTIESNKEYSDIVNKIQKEIFGEQHDLITFVETMSQDVILNNCKFGVFSISSTGDVYLCPDIGSLLPIANIRTTPFAEIWKKSLIAETTTDISRLLPCSDCELMYICGGGCRTKEFPELVKRISFDDIDYSKIPARNCSTTIKERFYRLMIESNEYLYKTLYEE